MIDGSLFLFSLDRWAYVVKVWLSGEVDCLKVWLTAKAYMQIYGFD